MAAYAALVSLLYIMDQIHDHPRLSIILQQNQIELLQQSLNRLLEFVQSGHVHRCHEEEAQSLESQITSAAYAAEDVIEAHVVEQIPDFRSDHLLDLHEIIQAMDHVNKNVATFEEKIKDQEPMYQLPITSASTSSSSRTPPMINTEKNTLIGFDDELYQLKDFLTGNKSSRQIISIVGMGGIGKTTLAKTVYDELSLKWNYFDVCAWVTITQEYDINDIFSNLLSPKSKPTLETVDQNIQEEFYKNLIGRRYLIVLDDMWSIEVWDKIKKFFPDNNNRSRVIITTRQSNMVACLDTLLLPLGPLAEDKSWELFCKKAFPQEDSCPPDLEKFGKNIVKKCGGLPLLIVVIGALLRKSSKTPKYWKDISHDINPIILNSNDEETKRVLDILGLSYRYLPSHLKPCFLYMGVFPKDNKIPKSRLIKLWVAEGFVKPNESQSLEEVAGGYLKDLVDRNLVGLNTNRYGKRETYQMHDLLIDLCLQLAEKENFLHVIRANRQDQCHVDNTNKGRRIVFQRGTSSDQTTSTGLDSASPQTRSLVSHDGDLQFINDQFELLRVLQVPNSSRDIDVILKQVNLRYICKGPQESTESRILSSISLLWNLQTIIIKTNTGKCLAPPEIWTMRQLRHVNIHKIKLPHPPSSSSQSDDEVVLRNLQSLKRTRNLSSSKEVCKRIGNVKKLSVVYNKSSKNSSMHDFASLHKLESLKCGFKKIPDSLQNQITFPSCLKKLVLRSRDLRHEELTRIGSLPNLEVFKILEKSSFVGSNSWQLTEGGFVRLKFLLIDDCDLIKWEADDDFKIFPVLEKLVLCELKRLDKIPLLIGEMLSFISLDRCSMSAAMSAMKILAQQLDLGNDDLQLQICYKQKMLQKFNSKAKDIECLNSPNFRLIRKF